MPAAPVSGSIAVAASSMLAYGGHVEFDTTVTGRLASRGYVYVTVVAKQGATVVYQWSGAPSFSFPLVDQAGRGLDWGSGPAECEAWLVYRIDGRRPTVQRLDGVAFEVEG